MSEESYQYFSEVDEEDDKIAEFVEREGITARCYRIEYRPDVSIDEQTLWQKQDPDYPLEHYRCLVKRKDAEIELFQTVGADYPDEDAEDDNVDLYSDNRELLLSPEFLIESAALKANSVDEAASLDEWIAGGYCETKTPEETYDQYKKIRSGLYDLLGESLYRSLVQLAVEADLERDEESEDET